MIALLNEEQVKTEKELVNGIKSGKRHITVSTKLSNKEIMTVFKLCLSECAEFVDINNTELSFSVGLGRKTVVFNPKKAYSILSGQIVTFSEKEVAYLRQRANGIVNSLNPKSKNDMMRAVGIYDYLCKTVKYGVSDNAHDAWGALIDKTAVCEGIAYGFDLLSKLCGLDSVIVQGTLNSGNHAWNMVKIDGLFYHVDVTSALEEGRLSNITNYDYIFMNDADLADCYSWDSNLYPKCTCDKHSYFKQTNSLAYSIDDVSRIVKRQIESKRIIYLKTEGKFRLTDDEIYNIISKTAYESRIDIKSVSVRSNPNLGTVQVKYN